MSARTRCNTCGAHVASMLENGCCPACLMRLGLNSDGSPTSSHGVSRPSSHGARETHIGPYFLVDTLGEGPVTVAYLVEDRTLRSGPLVLKVVKWGSGDAILDVIERLEMRGRALRSPEIVGVTDTGVTGDGRPWVVMPFIDGVPIAGRAGSKRPTRRQRLSVLLDVCRVAQGAHECGLVHNRLTPDNVLVAEIDGYHRPRLLDLTVVSATYPHTDRHARQRDGRERYLAPEVRRSGPTTDVRVDVYSIGVLLEETLGSDPRRELDGVVSEELTAFARAARADRPEQRPASLSDAITVLGACLAD